MKNKKQIYGNLFKIMGIILIFLALFITTYYLVEDYMSGINSKKITDEIEKILPDKTDNQNLEKTTANIDNNDYIGILTIQSIGIKLPVLAEWNFDKLKIAPARYAGDAYMGNFIIAGHSYRSHFGNIGKLEDGDKAKFEDISGHTFEYEVIKKEVIHETDIKKIKEGNYDLTIFTCKTTNNNYRITIRFRKIAVY